MSLPSQLSRGGRRTTGGAGGTDLADSLPSRWEEGDKYQTQFVYSSQLGSTLLLTLHSDQRRSDSDLTTFIKRY